MKMVWRYEAHFNGWRLPINEQRSYASGSNSGHVKRGASLVSSSVRSISVTLLVCSGPGDSVCADDDEAGDDESSGVPEHRRSLGGDPSSNIVATCRLSSRRRK
jgi:hypothetical protein